MTSSLSSIIRAGGEERETKTSQYTPAKKTPSKKRGKVEAQDGKRLRSNTSPAKRRGGKDAIQSISGNKSKKRQRAYCRTSHAVREKKKRTAS